MKYFIIIQKNYEIMSVGISRKEALLDLCEWTDFNDIEEIPYKLNYNSSNDGDLVLLECTEELYANAVLGGQFYDVENNIAIIDHDAAEHYSNKELS